MRIVLYFMLGCLLMAGCSNGTGSDGETSGGAAVGENDMAGGADEGSEGSSGSAAEPGPVALEDGGSSASLGPQNTQIQFIGKHTDQSRPDRVGVFESFEGTIKVDSESQSIESIDVTIQTGSLWVSIDRLLNHLKSADFLEVQRFPTAQFESTNIEPAEDGQVNVTGDLTLHGQTNEITFPASVAINDEGLTLTSQFVIDRTRWGIDYGPDSVEKEVTLNIDVGKPTTRPQQGQARSGRGGGGRRNFDPASVFSRLDNNGDGKLSGDEIIDRMRDNLEETDTNGDGEISQEEFVKRMSQMRGRSGGQGGRGDEQGGN